MFYRGFQKLRNGKLNSQICYPLLQAKNNRFSNLLDICFSSFRFSFAMKYEKHPELVNYRPNNVKPLQVCQDVFT